MQNWILGSEFVDLLGHLDVAFVSEFVAKGFTPHNHEGQPYTPEGVVNKIISGLEDQLFEHQNILEDFEEEKDKSGYEEYFSEHMDPLLESIQSSRDYLATLDGIGWNGFELPEDQDLLVQFIAVLMDSYYSREEVDKLQLPQSAQPSKQKRTQTTQTHEQLQNGVEDSRLRLEQMQRLICRVVAERLWKQNPKITIAEMLLSDEIANVFVDDYSYDDDYYIEDKIIRNWIKDLCPNRRLGRPKKMKD
jgi:hypothetical protein